MYLLSIVFSRRSPVYFRTHSWGGTKNDLEQDFGRPSLSENQLVADRPWACRPGFPSLLPCNILFSSPRFPFFRPRTTPLVRSFFSPDSRGYSLDSLNFFSYLFFPLSLFFFRYYAGESLFFKIPTTFFLGLPSSSPIGVEGLRLNL